MYSTAVHVHHQHSAIAQHAPLALDLSFRMPNHHPQPPPPDPPPPVPAPNPSSAPRSTNTSKEKETISVNAIPAMSIRDDKIVYGDAQSSSIRSYTLLKVVGDGSFGAVWLCDWHSALPPNTPLSPMQCGQGAKPEYAGKRLVAIKKMKKKWEGGWNECRKLKELESLRDIPPHQNIIPLYDCFLLPSSKELYFVFESMEGNLYQLIKSRKGVRPFAGGLVSSVFRQVVSGLLHIHSSGYFHRDMKPENLLVTTTGLADYQPTSPLALPGSPPEKDVVVIVKLADFGLARETKSLPPYTEYVSTRWYRAPEVLLRSTDYSKHVDTWALGTILAELITLKPLFPGQGEIDQVHKICEVLGDPSDEYGQDFRGRSIGGGRWTRGMRMAKQVGFTFPKHMPVDLHSLFDPSVPPSLIECIADLLKYDPDARLTAKDCMEHRYLVETTPFFVQPTTLQIPTHSSSSSSSLNSSRIGAFPSVSPRSVPPSHSQSPPGVTRPPFNFNGPSSHSNRPAPLHPHSHGPIASSSTHRVPFYPPAGAAELVDHLREQDLPHAESSAYSRAIDRAAHPANHRFAPMDISYNHQHSLDANGTNGDTSRHDPSSTSQHHTVAASQKFGMFGSLKKQKWSLFSHPSSDKQHSLPPVEELTSASVSRSTPSLKRTQSNSTSDSQSLPEMSPIDPPPRPIILDPKKLKKEQERAAREAEKQRRAAAEKGQKEQARAVMQKRNRIIQQNAAGSDFDWRSSSFRVMQANQSSVRKEKERQHYDPVERPTPIQPPVIAPPKVYAESSFPLVNHSSVDDRPTAHRDKRRRDMRSEDESLSIDSDGQSVSRLSMISFATVDSDPGPLRPPRRRTSVFGINRTTSSNSLRTSSHGYTPSPRSSNSIEPSGHSSNSIDQSSQSDYGERYISPGTISPPPMQMLSLSPVQHSQPWSPDGSSFVSDGSPVLLQSRRLGSQHHLTLPPLSSMHLPTGHSSPFEFGLGSRSHPPSPGRGPLSAINPIFQVQPPAIPTSPPSIPNHPSHSLPPFSALASVAEMNNPPTLP